MITSIKISCALFIIKDNLDLIFWTLNGTDQLTCVRKKIQDTGADVLGKRVKATWVEGSVNADLQSANFEIIVTGVKIVVLIGKTILVRITFYIFI